MSTPVTPPDGPQPVASTPVEWKVKAATVASYVGGVVALWALQLLSDGALVDTYSNYLPPVVSTFVLPLLPSFFTFAAGWITRHTPRSSGFGDNVDARIAELVEASEKAIEERVVSRLNGPVT